MVDMGVWTSFGWQCCWKWRCRLFCWEEELNDLADANFVWCYLGQGQSRFLGIESWWLSTILSSNCICYFTLDVIVNKDFLGFLSKNFWKCVPLQHVFLRRLLRDWLLTQVALPHIGVANDGTSCVVLTICGDHESLDLPKSLFLPGMDMYICING